MTTAPDHVHTFLDGEKCSECDSPMAVVMGFAGGATTFEEYDRYTAAQDEQMAVQDEMNVFNAIIDNIRWNDQLAPRDKAMRIADLANALGNRVDAALAAEIAEGADSFDATTLDPGSTMVFKDLHDEWRWVSIHTNRYEDRQKEIFPEEAHKAFVEETWRTKQFPVLRIWHLPADIGRADFIDYDTEGFVVASGTFTKGYEDVAQNLARMKGLGCSHGFLYRPSDLQDGVYKAYRSWEISVLPRDKAANTLTAFFAGEEIPMLTPERKHFLEESVGPERAAQIESGVRDLAAVAEAKGISYKSLEEAIANAVAAETPPPDAPPAAADGEPAPAAAAKDEPEAAAAGDAPPSDAPVPTAEDLAAAQAAAEAAAAAGLSPEGAASPAEKSLADAFKGAVAPLLDQLIGLKATVEAQAAEIAALKQSDGERLAGIVRPRVGPIGGHQPSASDANVLSEADAARIKAQGGAEPDGAPLPASKYADDAMNVLRSAPMNGAH